MILILTAAALVAAVPASADTRGSGESLYGRYCLQCHGAHGIGNLGKGPSLVGVGARAADFYLTTGYMPLRKPNDQPGRRRVAFSDDELAALVRYVASLGGPPVPKPHPERGNVSEGMVAFADHCAGCHQILGEGGIVTGAYVPSLGHATARQIAEAVRIGPYLMPRFSRKQLSDRDLDSIIRYVQAVKAPKDAGGWGLGHIGPVPEGLVAWLVAGTALLGVAAAIGKRVKS